jgi:AraC-like DNA-binding protein
MRKDPVISRTVAIGLLDAIKAAGADADFVVQAAGIKRAVLEQPEGFIAASLFANILEQAARVSGDDAFGMHFGEQYNPKDIGPLVYVILNSPTIAAGLANTARYLRIHNQAAKGEVVIERDRACITFVPNQLPTEASRQHNEYAMTVALSTIRLMVGSEWTPQEVHFMHHLATATPEHSRIFRAPVLFDCSVNAFLVPTELLPRHVPAADARLYRVLKTYVDTIMDGLPQEDEMLAQIRRAIAEALRDGHPKLSRVAKQVAMSPRSLQRRLGEWRLDFKRLVDDTRQRIAIEHLRRNQDSLTEIAFMLGYSDLSAFTRAFKRWTGTAPIEYRRRSAG